MNDTVEQPKCPEQLAAAVSVAVHHELRIARHVAKAVIRYLEYGTWLRRRVLEEKLELLAQATAARDGLELEVLAMSTKPH